MLYKIKILKKIAENTLLKEEKGEINRIITFIIWGSHSFR
jgi:hypothetical protein